MAAADAKTLMVGENGFYSGLIMRDQLQQALRSGMADTAISQLVLKDHPHVHPDHSLDLVLERLGKSSGILPVVSRNETRHVQGAITPEMMIGFLQKMWGDRSTA